MKLVKAFGFAGLITVALVALSGVASATYITSPANTTYTNTFELRSGGITFHSAVGTAACNKSELKGKIEFHAAGITAGGNLSSATFTECGSDVITVLKPGALEFSPATPTGNGTVVWTGAEVRIHTDEGPVCTIKTTGATDIGTLTGSNNTGGNAVLHTGKPLPLSGFLCPATTTMTGVYAVINPAFFAVH
jgi:hypothetical protein